jgi:hypothetical protein
VPRAPPRPATHWIGSIPLLKIGDACWRAGVARKAAAAIQTIVLCRPRPAQLRATSLTLDGEAVVCGPDGVAIFDALHRRGTISEAMLYAFDLLELEGQDLRALPLGDRKKRLQHLEVLAQSSAHFLGDPWIASTAVYTARAPNRFKDFWRE